MRNDGALALAVLLAVGSTSSASAGSAPFAAQLLHAHNLERRAVGVAPMVWDARLAATADSFAAELARTGRWGHSPAHQRVGQGENLWMGTRGAFSPTSMIADWASEKRMFRAGVFPHVSRSGYSWHDVGHYTQIIWPATRRVGCSIRSSARWDFLVCRYSAPGNASGERVGVTRVATR